MLSWILMKFTIQSSYDFNLMMVHRHIDYENYLFANFIISYFNLCFGIIYFNLI